MVNKGVVLEAIATHPWTALFLSTDGQLADFVPFDGKPTPQDMDDALALRRSGYCAFRLVPQGNLTEAELDEMVMGLVRTKQYAQAHVLRPGINIPGTPFAGRPRWHYRIRQLGRSVLAFGARCGNFFR